MKKFFFTLSFILAFSFHSCFAKDTSNVHPFCLITIAKSGTHLIMRCLEQLSNKRKCFVKCSDVEKRCDDSKFYLWTHFQAKNTVYAMLALPQRKYILNIRDLRDVAISMTQDYIGHNKVPFYAKTALTKTWLELSLNDQLNALVQPEIWGMSNFYNNNLVILPEFLSLMHHPDVYVTSFEKLVGAKGGGSETKQIQEIINLAAFLNIEITMDEAKEIGDNLFGGTRTFRKGQINQWKEVFNEENVNLYKECMGEMLIQLGYEQDYNW